MSDDILVLPESTSNVDNLEPRDVPEEHEPFAGVRGARKIPHDARHAGKTLLERRMEEFERLIFMAREGIAPGA